MQVLRGEETTWSRLVDNLGMGSLFAEKRAVVVRNAEALKGDGEEMAAYLDDPTPGVTLVLLAAQARQAHEGLEAGAREGGGGRRRSRPRGAGSGPSPTERLRQRKLRLAEEGVVELVERVGQDLRRLMGEIDKLEAFASAAAKAS